MKHIKGWGEDDIEEILKILNSINKPVKKTKKDSESKKSKKSVKKSIKKSMKKSMKKSIKKSMKKKQKGRGIKNITKSMISEPFIVKPIWQEEEEDKQILPVEEMYLAEPVPTKIKYKLGKSKETGDLVNAPGFVYLEDESLPVKIKKFQQPNRGYSESGEI